MQILRNLRRSFFFFFPFTFSPLFALLWEGRESVKLNSGNNHRGLPRKGKFVNFLHRCICLAPPWMGKLRIEGETLFLVKSRYTRDLFRQIFRPSFICSNITFFRRRKRKVFILQRIRSFHIKILYTINYDYMYYIPWNLCKDFEIYNTSD